MGWREWIGIGAEEPRDGARTEVVARIASALGSLDDERARLVAAYAYHLGRIAHADHEFTLAERDTMRRLIAVESGLPAEQVELVVDLAARESLEFRGTEDYAVMREFDEIATYEQKLALIRCLFAVSAADARVVVDEDNEIRRIALALKVPHEDFVSARADVRQHLAVLERVRP